MIIYHGIESVKNHKVHLKQYKNIPVSSRYVKFLPFGRFLLVKFGTNFTHKRKIQVYINNYKYTYLQKKMLLGNLPLLSLEPSFSLKGRGSCPSFSVGGPAAFSSKRLPSAILQSYRT